MHRDTKERHYVKESQIANMSSPQLALPISWDENKQQMDDIRPHKPISAIMGIKVRLTPRFRDFTPSTIAISLLVGVWAIF